MASDTFLLLLKPDAVRRRLVGDIVSRFEKRGYTILDVKYIRHASESVLSLHYSDHTTSRYWDTLLQHMTSGPIIVVMLRGDIDVARGMVGNAYPYKALPGTIRGDYSHSITENLVHCSHSSKDAEEEIRLWFSE